MPPQTGEKKARIGWITAGLMLGVALLLDAIQALGTLAGTALGMIPIVGIGFVGLGVVFASYISIFSVCVFGLWFMVKGVSYLDRNGATKLIIVLSSTITELVGFINAIPAITFGVLALILISRAEDGKAGLLNMMKRKSALGKKEMGAERQKAAREWAAQRTAKDEASAEANRVNTVRERNNVEDFSSPLLRSFYQEQEEERLASETRERAREAA
jgi:hypothetical protein